MTQLRYLVLWLVLALPVPAFGQATHLSTSGTLPASCRVGDVYYKTGASSGVYRCSATNTWTAVPALPIDLTSGITGTLPVANGGTNVTSATDDNTLVGNGTTWQLKALASCSNGTTSKLLYDTSSNAFSCGTDQTGTGSSVTATGTLTSNALIAGNGGTDIKAATAAANSKLLGSGASGSGAAYAELTLGTNLSMSGTTLNATGGGGSGALELIEQHTASSSASLDFTSCISSTYDEYLVELINILPATNATTLYLRVSTDGGSTYISTNSYAWDQYGWRAGGSGGDGGTARAAIVLNFATTSNTANQGEIRGSFRLFDPESASLYKGIVGQTRSYSTVTSTIVNAQVSGEYQSATAVTDFQLVMSSGAIASGTGRCYGVAK